MSSDNWSSLIERDVPREIKFQPHINPYAAGSVIIEYGMTKVHITVAVQESVPPFLKGRGTRWVTAEYAMLPGSTQTRIERDRKGVSGRSQEIQRLIGRSLRAIVDLKKLGERSLIIDCDVLLADGGTRTAAITGGYVALEFAIKKLMKDGVIEHNPLKGRIAAVSIGINQAGKVVTDLNYEEDSSCETDVNLVLTSDGRFVELQGTAEGEPFEDKYLQAILVAGRNALKKVFEEQNKVLKE